MRRQGPAADRAGDDPGQVEHAQPAERPGCLTKRLGRRRAELLDGEKRQPGERLPLAMGQYHLITGNMGEARRMFQLSINTEVTNFIEYTGSEAELKRLNQSQG